ncbi:hypothetical protein DOTSEDRAFT_21452 [Dothistroma septosporum NZE10]|uniref:Uncharacterized protein n=1 Tax=Dothistroma septosporum (strain NZE10 / CBS 128990) TaxID=675120 RepID=N1PW22_DOTSN|nr:hypothetical protein DOTSEDRAFT_21452 [Dothistroma septosporum NZE10]
MATPEAKQHQKALRQSRDFVKNIGIRDVTMKTAGKLDKFKGHVLPGNEQLARIYDLQADILDRKKSTKDYDTYWLKAVAQKTTKLNLDPEFVNAYERDLNQIDSDFNTIAAGGIPQLLQPPQKKTAPSSSKTGKAKVKTELTSKTTGNAEIKTESGRTEREEGEEEIDGASKVPKPVKTMTSTVIEMAREGGYLYDLKTFFDEEATMVAPKRKLSPQPSTRMPKIKREPSVDSDRFSAILDVESPGELEALLVSLEDEAEPAAAMPSTSTEQPVPKAPFSEDAL